MQETRAAVGRARTLAWLPVALWTGLIFGLSMESFSADETSRIVGPLLDFFFPGLDAASRAFAHYLVRKGAHAFEYAVLALFVGRALRLQAPTRTGRNAVLAIGFVALVATLDETGQATRGARTGSARDVLLDTAAGAAALSLARALRGTRHRTTPP